MHGRLFLYLHSSLTMLFEKLLILIIFPCITAFLQVIVTQLASPLGPEAAFIEVTGKFILDEPTKEFLSFTSHPHL